MDQPECFLCFYVLTVFRLWSSLTRKTTMRFQWYFFCLAVHPIVPKRITLQCSISSQRKRFSRNYLLSFGGKLCICKTHTKTNRESTLATSGFQTKESITLVSTPVLAMY